MKLKPHNIEDERYEKYFNYYRGETGHCSRSLKEEYKQLFKDISEKMFNGQSYWEHHDIEKIEQYIEEFMVSYK